MTNEQLISLKAHGYDEPPAASIRLIKLYLKSGQTLEFRCKEFSAYKDKETGSFYHVEWVDADRYLNLDVNELVAYEMDKEDVK